MSGQRKLRKSRVRSAAVTLRKYMRQHPNALRQDLDLAIAHHKVSLDTVLRYLADAGFLTISVKDIKGDHRRRLVTKAEEMRARDGQRLLRGFGEQKRLARAARALSDRKPNDSAALEEANRQELACINTGDLLGYRASAVITMLEEVKTLA